MLIDAAFAPDHTIVRAFRMQRCSSVRTARITRAFALPWRWTPARTMVSPMTRPKQAATPNAKNTQFPHTTSPVSSPKLKPTSHATKPLPNAQPAKIISPAPKTQHVYREQLLVYHAGQPRTIFLTCFKLTGIFIFIFSAFMIAPAYYLSPYEPTWMAPVILLGGAIPLTIMTFTTAPFVTYVHLYLPTWARASTRRLHRYAASLPSSAQLDITTLKWVWPRVTRLRAGELYLHKGEIFGALTLRREVPAIVSEQRKWYDWQPIKRFYVAGKSGAKVPERGIWEGVVESIVRGWAKPGQRDKLLSKEHKP